MMRMIRMMKRQTKRPGWMQILCALSFTATGALVFNPAQSPSFAADYGKPLQSVVTDIARLSFGRTALLTDEYFTLRLFDEKNLQSPKTSFAGKIGILHLFGRKFKIAEPEI